MTDTVNPLDEVQRLKLRKYIRLLLENLDDEDTQVELDTFNMSIDVEPEDFGRSLRHITSLHVNLKIIRDTVP